MVHVNKSAHPPLRIFYNVNNLLGLKKSYTYVQEINHILMCKVLVSLGGNYEENYLPARAIMHSDRFCNVLEAYSAFLLRAGQSLHSLLLNSEFDEANSYLKSVDNKGHGAMFQEVVGYTDKRRCRTYS